MRTHRNSRVRIAFGFGVLLAAPAPVVAGVAISRIMLTGDLAPGRPGHFSTYVKTTECINASGQVAFRALPDGDQISAWTGTPGHLHLVPDSTGNVVHDLWIDDTGAVFFMPKKYTLAQCVGRRSWPIYESYQDPPSRKTRRRNKSRRANKHKKNRRARKKAKRPKKRKRKALTAQDVRVTASGDVVFILDKRTPVIAQVGRPSPLVEGGTVVPGLDNPNLTFERFSDLRTSSAGYYVFGGWIAGPGISHLRRCDYFVGNGTAVRRLEFPEPLVDHFTRSATFFNSLTVNATGTVAFIMTGDLWMYRDSTWTVFSASDTPRAGSSATETYGTFKALVFHDDGTMAFGSGHSRYGWAKLWMGPPDSSRLVAAAGMHAPGTPDGVVFKELRTFESNRNGQMVFEGWLTGSGLDQGRDTAGIWSFSNGKLEMVIRQGDRFEVADGDTRRIRRVFLSPGSHSDDAQRTFNDSGQFLFSLELDAVPGVADQATGLFVGKLQK